MRLGDDEIIYITCLNRRIHFSIEDTPVKTYSSIIGKERSGDRLALNTTNGMEDNEGETGR